MEANTQSNTTISQGNILKAKEKYLRCAADHPKRIAFDSNAPQRLLTPASWQKKTTELSDLFPYAFD